MGGPANGSPIAKRSSMPDQEPPKKGGVGALNLKYLEASFEGFRRSTHSLMTISGGAVVALLGLFPVLLPSGVGVATVASEMMRPVGWFLAAVIVALVAQIVFSLSAHYAAWGGAAGERCLRIAGIASLLLGTVLFAIGAFATIEVVGDPSWRTEREIPQSPPVAGDGG